MTADLSAATCRTIPGLLTALPTDADYDSTPFQSRPWITAWLDVYCPDEADLFTALIDDPEQGSPLLVLPLVRRNMGGLTVLAPPDGGVSDYEAPWLRRDFSPSAAEFSALWRMLVRSLPPADLVVLEKCPRRVAQHVNPLFALPASVASPLNRHPLGLDAPYDELVEKRFDGSCMRSLAKKRRKLEHKGELVFSVHADGADAEVERQLGRVLGWRALRFADRNTPEKLERDGRFYRTLLRETDIARLMTLTLDGEIIAGCYGTISGGAFQLLGVAYDEAWKNWSPGLQVLLDVVRWAGEEGLAELDFTIGDESYKALFDVDDDALFEVREPLSLKGRVACLKVRLRRLARDLLRDAGAENLARRVMAHFTRDR